MSPPTVPVLATPALVADSRQGLRSSLDSLSIGGATTLHGYAYDASGARLADTTAGLATQEYQLDAAGRMVGSAFSISSMHQILLPNSCRYDADGRAAQVCGGGIVGLSGENVVRDPGGDWWYVPTQGLDEPLLAIKRGLHAGDTTTDAIFPIVTDGRSQLVAIADSLGHIDNSNATTGFHQGPWGSSGTTSRAQTLGPSRWAVDTGALGGISSFRNRQYDPGTGKWLQEDPAGLAGGVNLYEYNGNDPNSFSDPFGLCPPADANVGDCAHDNLGNAWRILDSTKTGRRVIATYVRSGYSVVTGDCGSRVGANCTSRARRNVTLADRPAGAIAVGLAHESVHVAGSASIDGDPLAYASEEEKALNLGFDVFESLTGASRSEAAPYYGGGDLKRRTVADYVHVQVWCKYVVHCGN